MRSIVYPVVVILLFVNIVSCQLPFAPNACTNEADRVVLQGARDAIANMMSWCTLYHSPSMDEAGRCISGSFSLSPNCADCHGGLCVCASQNCFWACSHRLNVIKFKWPTFGYKELKCQQCILKAGCFDNFQTCTGLPESFYIPEFQIAAIKAKSDGMFDSSSSAIPAPPTTTQTVSRTSYQPNPRQSMNQETYSSIPQSIND